MLLSTIMTFNLMLGYFFQLNEFGFIIQTGKNDFITTQMNDRIWEYINDLSEYLFNQFVSLV